MRSKPLAAISSLIILSTVSAQWQSAEEFYYENRETGLKVYYSPQFYAQLDPKTKNYKEYRYDTRYGKDYYWENYDGGIYSEREFIARYEQLTYFTDKNDEFTDWGQQMGLAGGLAAACCIIICFAVVCSQCIQRRRKRKAELKARKQLAEMEGINMSKSSNDSDGNSDLTDGNGTKDPDMKKKNKTTKQKMKDALSKKQQESMSRSNPFASEKANKSSSKLKKSDPTVVLDMSDEDPNEGSQR